MRKELIKAIDEILNNNNVILDRKVINDIVKVAVPVEKVVQPKLKKSLEKRIETCVDEIRKEESVAIKRIRWAIEGYATATTHHYDDKERELERRINNVLIVHKDCVRLLKKNMFNAVLSSLDLTDSVSLRQINKKNRGYADGYLSHYSQARGKVKDLRIKI